jgi:hypothetical protein
VGHTHNRWLGAPPAAAFQARLVMLLQRPLAVVLAVVAAVVVRGVWVKTAAAGRGTAARRMLVRRCHVSLLLSFACVSHQRVHRRAGDAGSTHSQASLGGAAAAGAATSSGHATAMVARDDGHSGGGGGGGVSRGPADGASFASDRQRSSAAALRDGACGDAVRACTRGARVPRAY